MFKGYNENRDVEINPKMNLFQFKKKNEFSFTTEKVSGSYCPPHTVCNLTVINVDSSCLLMKLEFQRHIGDL